MANPIADQSTAQVDAPTQPTTSNEQAASAVNSYEVKVDAPQGYTPPPAAPKDKPLTKSE